MKRTIERVKEILAELDYAQRRMLEIRTGVGFDAQPPRFRAGMTVEELEALFRL